MTFQYLPTNQKYAFFFGDAIQRLDGEDWFFDDRQDAKRALARLGLRLTNRNTVKVLEA